MSDAIALDSGIDEGWYDDPATPNMERFWNGSEWTDHVRYTDKVRPRTELMQPPAALSLVEPTQPAFESSWLATPVVERPQLAIAAEPAFAAVDYASPAFTQPAFTQPVFTQPALTQPAFTAPAYTPEGFTGPTFTSPVATSPAWAAPVAEGFNDFYVPMRRYDHVTGAAEQPLKKPRSKNAVLLWVGLLAAVGIALGTGMWVFLPH